VLGCFLTVAILLATPATALAGEGYDLSFRFTAGNGYRITVGGYDATARRSPTRLMAAMPGAPM
jgi:hypothetical protein